MHCKVFCFFCGIICVVTINFFGCATQPQIMDKNSDKKSVQNDENENENDDFDDAEEAEIANRNNKEENFVGDSEAVGGGSLENKPPILAQPVEDRDGNTIDSVELGSSKDALKVGKDNDLFLEEEIEEDKKMLLASPDSGKKATLNMVEMKAKDAVDKAKNKEKNILESVDKKISTMKSRDIEKSWSDFISRDVNAQISTLRWVDYHFERMKNKLTIEMRMSSRAEYEVFSAVDSRQEDGLLFRFYLSKISKKMRYNIDSSEFCSPISAISMYENKSRGYVDVFLTYTKSFKNYADKGQLVEGAGRRGSIQVIFGLPGCDNRDNVATQIVMDTAQSLVPGETKPLLKSFAVGVDSGPRKIGLVRKDGDQQEIVTPIRELIQNNQPHTLAKDGLPESFDRTALSRVGSFKSGWRIKESTLMGVASDNIGSIDTRDLKSGSQMGSSPSFSKGFLLAQSEIKVNSNQANNESNNNDEEENNNSNEQDNSNPVNPQGKNGIEEAEVETLFESLNEQPVRDSQVPPAISPDQKSGSQDRKNASGKNSQAQEFGNATKNQIPQKVLDTKVPRGSMEDQQPSKVNRNQSVTSPEVEGKLSSDTGAVTQFSGRAVQLDFYGAELGVVLATLKEQTGYTYIYNQEIGAIKVTVHFQNVPWDQALTAILETYGLGIMAIGEKVFRIDRLAALTDSIKARENAANVAETQVLVYSLNHAIGKDLVGKLNSFLGGGAKVSSDDRTNKIIIEAPKRILAKANEIIRRLDIETRQVEIASRIIEVQKNQSNFFGVSWLNNLNFDPGRALGFGTLNFPNSLGSSFAVDPGVSKSDTSGVGRFRFGSLNKFIDLDLLLKLEEKKGTTNVLQSNRVLVLDGQKASIVSGSSQFFRPAAGSGAPLPGAGGVGAAAGGTVGLSEVQFNLSLNVTPQVTALNSVILKLAIKSDTPGDTTGESLATKNTRNLETQMVRGNGDTGVIGGIYDTNRTTTISGVPFLSDIPILGALFRSTNTTEKQTELLIMVTPSIVPTIESIDQGSIGKNSLLEKKGIENSSATDEVEM